MDELKDDKDYLFSAQTLYTKIAHQTTQVCVHTYLPQKEQIHLHQLYIFKVLPLTNEERFTGKQIMMYITSSFGHCVVAPHFVTSCA